MNSVQEFLQWWTEQLADCLPAALKRQLQRHRTVLQLISDGPAYRLQLSHEGKTQALGDWPGLESAELATLLRDQPAVEQIELQLAPGQYLTRSVDLPLAAAVDLQQAIGYQIEALTPFRREQLWLFCGEQQRLPDNKRLRAWLVAVPRQVTQVLDQLGLAVHDAPPRGPRQAPAEGGPVLLSLQPRRARKSGIPIGRLLIALNLAALVLALSLHLDNRQAELRQLQAQGRALQQQAIAASDLAQEADQLQQRLESLRQQRAGTPITVAVIEELSHRLDNQTWLQRLELRQQQLRLQGSSNNASALIATLDDSPLFSDVRFEAALTRDPTGGERFNLSANVGPTKAQPDDNATEDRP